MSPSSCHSTHMPVDTHTHTLTNTPTQIHSVVVRMLEVSSFSWRAYLSLSLPLHLPLFLHSQSLRDAATSVQFNSSLIHVLRVNGNKLSKLSEPPTGLRQREGGGGRRDWRMPQLSKGGSSVTREGRER